MKVSVIIPVYNVERYLERCLDSVLGQTMHDFEVICVDDGSTDQSGRVLEEYAKRDSRVRVLSQENAGLSIARNNGLKTARGTFVLFCDSDDAIHPRLLELVVGKAEHLQADLVSFSYVSNGGSGLPEMRKYDGLARVRCRVSCNPMRYLGGRSRWSIHVNVWTKLYRRSFLSGIEFMPSICFEDYPYTVAVLTKQPRAVLLDIPLYYYTKDNVSITRSEFSVQKIRDYHKGICSVLDVCRCAGRGQKAHALVLKRILPKLLKQQLNRILRSDKSVQPELWKAFQIQLVDLDQKGCIRMRDHKLRRYLRYRKLIGGQAVWNGEC